MAGGSAYKSPEKLASTLPGKPQDAWNGPASGEPQQAATKGSIANRSGGRRNSIMDLLDQHGDQDKQLIDRAGFEALCDELGLRLNTLEKRRAFSSLDAMDGSKDGQLEYSYVRRRPALAPHPATAVAAILPTRVAFQVHAWVRDKRQLQLRSARQLARKLFDMADADSSGFLDKAEVTQVEKRLVQRCPEVELVPPFDPDKDFATMDKDGHGQVSWSEFEGTSPLNRLPSLLELRSHL